MIFMLYYIVVGYASAFYLKSDSVLRVVFDLDFVFEVWGIVCLVIV